VDGTVTVSSDRERDTPSLFRALAEASPMPMVAVEGADHIVRYVNPVFCLLADKSSEQLTGKPFCEIVPTDDLCLPLLDKVYKTGQAEVFTAQEDSTPNPWYWSYGYGSTLTRVVYGRWNMNTYLQRDSHRQCRVAPLEDAVTLCN
jgi:PAS domain-containing protein